MGNLLLSNLKILFGRRLLILFFFVIPLLLSFIVNYAKIESKPPTIVASFTDEDHTLASSNLLKSLTSGGGITLIQCDRATADQFFNEMKVESKIIIDKGYQESLGAMDQKTVELTNLPYSFAGTVISEIIGMAILENSSVTTLDLQMKALFESQNRVYSDQNRNEILAFYQQKMSSNAYLQVKYETYPEKGIPPVDISKIFYVGGVGIFLVFMMMISVYSSDLFCRNIENGVFAKASTMKNGVLKISAGVIFSLFLIGLLQIVIYLTFTFFSLGTSLGVLLLQFVILACALLLFILIGFLLSAILKTKEKLHIAAFYLSFLTGIAGGCFFNVGTGVLKTFSLFTPQGFVINALEIVSGGNQSIGDVLLFILCALSVSLFVYFVSYQVLKRSIQRNALH